MVELTAAAGALVAATAVGANARPITTAAEETAAPSLLIFIDPLLDKEHYCSAIHILAGKQVDAYRMFVSSIRVVRIVRCNFNHRIVGEWQESQDIMFVNLSSGKHDDSARECAWTFHEDNGSNCYST
ncbi:hypothetical protein [Massilia timonae]|uniref:hypothetical protein n=1 Tax=Massilia timonae TaxID=47229 RepID=UPI00289F3779|nr:hypothetical protein [Massilia timonae]